MSEYIVELNNLTVYRGQSKVFERLSFAVKAGECLAIIGPNGSGKTTLLKLLSREIYPVDKSDGYLKIFGERHVNLWELRKRVGFVSPEFQQAYETLSTGFDVVLSAFFGSVGLHRHHQVTESQRNQADSIMRYLHIDGLKEKAFLSLSSGQQRRLLLARAIVHQPELLIFDEPTNNLDIGATAQLLDDMRMLARKGTSIILVTHHLHEIIPEIHRVIGIRRGKIQFDSEKSEALTSENLSILFETPLSISRDGGFYQWRPD